jgi:serine/threonine-protein kinase
MADDARLRQLLEVALDSDLTPEEVCRECPDLLPQVRRRWQHLRTVEAQVDALFPTPRSTEAAPPDELPALPGYEVLSVLGRGGMGVVYKARHLHLGRVVAVKMLLAGAAATAGERQPFLREARAAAGLRHPNVVQLHDVGEADGRPFYVMEFVEGGSLARKLAGAPQPAKQAAALVATLADAVQAAHESGVVHRDLKPGNVLLTADGTPKVCDFGLARPLEGGASLTLSGVPMGTPSYVAPEQARGDRAVGAAADVYALGAILYECLTGRPPFRAETAAATLFQVTYDDPVPPARLNPQVPRDLQTICLKCLHKGPHRRYASAQALADDLRRFESGEPIAARPAGVVGALRKWVRRRPAAAAMLAAVVLLVAVGAVGAWLFYQQRADARAHQARIDQEVLALLERGRGLLEEGWQAADEAKLTQASGEAERAADVARSGDASEAVRGQAEAFREDAGGRLERAQKGRALLEALQDVSVPVETPTFGQDAVSGPLVLAQPGADEQYASAFRRWGLDVDETEEAVVVDRLRAEPEPVMQEVVAGLDSWMLERRRRTLPEAKWRRLYRVADQLDRSERRRRLRGLLLGEAPPRAEGVAGLVAGMGSPWLALWELTSGNTCRPLLELRRQIDPRTEPALTVLLLASACAAGGDVIGAEQVLRQAATARPEEAVLLGALGKLVERQGRHRSAEAIGYYRAARSRRRHLGFALSRALIVAGKADEAEEVVRELALVPAHQNSPALPFLLGAIRTSQHRYAEAEAAYREAIRLRPGWAAAHSNLASALNREQKYGESEAACRKAIDLDPDCMEAYVNLGNALLQQGKPGAAEAACRKAIAIRPNPESHTNLGNALARQGKQREAEAAYLEALDLKPDFAEAHNNLGSLRVRQQRFAEAEAGFRKALDLAPDLAEAHNNLGSALLSQKKYDEAEAAIRKAIDLRPDFAVAHCNLGMVLLRQARFDEAAGPLKRAGDLSAATDPVHVQARKVEGQRQRFVTLRSRLPAVLAGKQKPSSVGEQVEFAMLCLFEKRYDGAARFCRDAFVTAPLLAKLVTLGLRYQAACAAAMAGCGQGQDADQLHDKGRAGWRRYALTWLRQDLAYWDRALDRGNEQMTTRTRQTMRLWLADGSFAGVRYRDAVARLPQEERQAWDKLWSDVEALLRRSSRSE